MVDLGRGHSRDVDFARPVEAQRQGTGDGGGVADAPKGEDGVVAAHDHGQESAMEHKPQDRDAQHRS